MQRILIIGCAGAGKSTLARQLGERLKLPIIHLDQHYWQAGWVESERTAWMEKVKELANQDNWVMDGNYGGTMDLRLQRADTVIYLDMPSQVCLWRVLKRTYKYYGKTRPDMPAGCPERYDWPFLHYVLVYNWTRRKGILKKIETLQSGQKTYRLRSSSAVEDFMVSMPT